MADENNSQSVSLEEYNKLKGDFEAQKTAFETQGKKLEKLEKIFEERQTKALDKEGILKALGLEKAPIEKPIGDVMNEKFNALNDLVNKLQADIKTKDEKLALNDKKQKVREAAKPYNFIDISDVPFL